MTELLEKLQAGTPEAIGHALAVAVLVLIGWLFYRYLIGSLHRLLVRVGVSPGVVSFLSNTVRALLVCSVVLAVLRQLGVETTSLIALLGAAGAALLLSLQGFMGNFAAGLVVLGQRTVRLGDFIEVGDVRGAVVEMQAFHVLVETPERVLVSLPNTLLMSAPMRNHSALPTRRIQWLLPAPVNRDLGPLKEALASRLLQDARILKQPSPAVLVRDWAMDKQTLAVQAWTASADALAVQEQLLEPLGRAVERWIEEGRKAAPAGP
jgi:small conductance mechanosensitive channel